ncbi:DUF2442 domain-containing protein [Prevotella sp. P2-180]|uniref:DUF2442 domain-containing protein n=1 Tax=Prevotella sp. P2-180 TaxID=2024224 RepID=UPI00209BCE19|nr:DUF2442 domain-containing protein [Prevotella sp. P2-180]
MSPPSLHVHYRHFNATTGQSATEADFGRFCLVRHFRHFTWHSNKKCLKSLFFSIIVCITPFSKWKRLENATKAQHDDFILGYTGIHWPSLDEDLGYEGLFVDAGLCEATPEKCSVVCEP